MAMTADDIVTMASEIQVGAFKTVEHPAGSSFAKWQREIRPQLFEKVRAILKIAFAGNESALAEMNAAVDAAQAAEAAKREAVKKSKTGEAA
jgi:hypothetical protein